ncbi:hypothetical protein KHS38_01730 [Mucilaginibacter sp. Bleaf8]|uniref:hypothetical protein n=1 Tax=Mucilaginibacter sp. Bleaf8 TaxID=2834430 RepID=UPI001BCF8031|nr:hypothetical protein [Mucilaginibacter sp. Bleaf8]MBS7563112.1 hypothetical protein [Mucilaginibacter sp. Bleaf8]
MNRGKYSGLFVAGIIALSGCTGKSSLQGTWQYSGGIYNGKKEGGTEGYNLQRTYKEKSFEAFMLEEGTEAQKFQAGNYELKGDSCFETETYSAQATKLSGVTLRYAYKIKNDTLILNGKLPTGMVVEEYWKKLK